MAKPVLRKPKKKVCAFCKDKAPGHRLQGHRPAAQVHLRPRQDPRPSGDRQLPPAPARRRHRGQERPRGGPAALHLDRSLRGRNIDEAHPHPGGPRPRRARRRRRGQGRLRPQLPAARAGWPSLDPGRARSRSTRSRRARKAREIRDLGHAREVAAQLGGLNVTVTAKAAGDSGRLFGSVTAPTSSTRSGPPAARRSTAARSSCRARSRPSASTRSRCACTRRSPPNWTSRWSPADAGRHSA